MRRFLLPLLAVVAGFQPAPALAQDPVPPPAPADSASTLDPEPGYFTARQARRGQDTYRKNCNSCHTTAAYSGAAFRRSWGGRSVFELWDQIRTTMPNDSPGRLKPGEYADIVAYLLRLNGLADGPDELPPDPDQLRALTITPPARPGR